MVECLQSFKDIGTLNFRDIYIMKIEVDMLDLSELSLYQGTRKCNGTEESVFWITHLDETGQLTYEPIELPHRDVDLVNFEETQLYMDFTGASSHELKGTCHQGPHYMFHFQMN